jgi:hypothetical protein
MLEFEMHLYFFSKNSSLKLIRSNQAISLQLIKRAEYNVHVVSLRGFAYHDKCNHHSWI